MKPATPFLPPFLLLAGPLRANAAYADVTETFSTGPNGWSSVDLRTDTLGLSQYTAVVSTLEVTHSDGGNPGGYFSAADPSSGSFYFQAPAAFLGNLAPYAGGTLSWDTIYTPTGSPWSDDPDIILSNGTTALFYDGNLDPAGAWTHVSVTLAPGAGWTVGSFGGPAATASDFAAVLPSVTLLRLRGEFYNGVAETTGVDNVALTSAVPEPKTWALVAVGILLLGRSVRTRLPSV